MRTNCYKVYTKFSSLYVAGNNVESEFFTIISIDSLLVHESKYYLHVYLDNCDFKIVDKQIIDYLNNLFESDGD